LDDDETDLGAARERDSYREIELPPESRSRFIVLRGADEGLEPSADPPRSLITRGAKLSPGARGPSLSLITRGRLAPSPLVSAFFSGWVGLFNREGETSRPGLRSRFPPSERGRSSSPRGRRRRSLTTRGAPPSGGVTPAGRSTFRTPTPSSGCPKSRPFKAPLREPADPSPPAAPAFRIVGERSSSEEIRRPGVPKFLETCRRPSLFRTFWACKATSLSRLSDGRRPGWPDWSEILPTRLIAFSPRATWEIRRF
jgi:hypothetical protein